MLTKLTTCCYCGTRAALVLKDHGHMELSCKGCGAPVTQMKQMPTPQKPARLRSFEQRGAKPRKSKKKKKKSPYRKAMKEVWDVLDDIFD